MNMSAFLGSEPVLDEVRNRIFFWRIHEDPALSPYLRWANAFAENYPQAERLGIPMPILDCGARLFAALPSEEAINFPLQFVDAIHVGADLMPAIYQFVRDMLIDSQVGAIRLANVEEQASLESISRLITPELSQVQYEEACEQVAIFELDRRCSMRTWDAHLRFAIGYVGNLSILLIGTLLHGIKSDLPFLVHQVIHWHLAIETYAQKAKLSDTVSHSPALQEIEYMAIRTTATRLTEHFLIVLAQQQ